MKLKDLALHVLKNRSGKIINYQYLFCKPFKIADFLFIKDTFVMLSLIVLVIFFSILGSIT